MTRRANGWRSGMLLVLLGAWGGRLCATEPVSVSAVKAPAPLRKSIPHGQQRQALSRIYTIDRLYRSMQGPSSTEPIVLLPNEPSQLVWITGYRAVMVGADGRAPMPQEFMCHSNLDFVDVTRHRQRFGMVPSISTRLFTLSQGQLSIRFPEGFGIPVFSDEPLGLTTQVLNHHAVGPPFEVRHAVTVEFVRDRELTQPMRPLFQKGVYGLALLDGTDGYFGVPNATETQHGSSCLIGTNASTHTYQDPFGRTFTGHWTVKPGREVNRTLVTKILDVPFDTTIHSIAVHVHPFAESLELRDLTTGTTLFKSRATNFSDRIGLSRVEEFSSAQGLPVFKDHDYELVSVYHNTTPNEQDSMAVMYLYLLDREFALPQPRIRSQAAQ